VSQQITAHITQHNAHSSIHTGMRPIKHAPESLQMKDAVVLQAVSAQPQAEVYVRLAFETAQKPSLCWFGSERPPQCW
jgi:hypothetical protein